MLALFFLRYKLLFEILIIGSLVLGAVYGVHKFLEYERDIGRNEVRAEYAQKLAEAKDAAYKRETELRTQRDEAVAQGATREALIRSLAAGSGSANRGLLNTLDNLSRGVPSSSVEALGKSVAALSAVLGECSTRYRDLAEKADRHANDAKTFNDAWPVTKTP